MKLRIASFILLCFSLPLFSGCIPAPPEHLPGMREEDLQFVWVCKEPFSYFVVDKEELANGYPCLKGYIKKEEEFLCFYMEEELNARSSFAEENIWKSGVSLAGGGKYYEDYIDAFWGYTEYYEDYFVFKAENDIINFFDGELPTLRFEKMTKDAFLEEYGEIENIPELLE